jgi:T-complex protein 1 subunit zeta
VDAVTCVYQHDPDTNSGKPIDLNLIEKLTIQRHAASDSRLVKGLVLDHGGRHPDMPSHLKDCYVLTLNVSLEYEQAETSAGFVYSTAEEREKLVQSERVWLDERCRKIVQLKRSVCDGDDDNNNKSKSFVIINQKGVDPLSLDMFAKEGILCLRRAKRRNMERLVLAAGGEIVQSLEDLSPSVLGQAGSVSQVEFDGDDAKYTFVEDCPNAKSCTLLLHGPNQLTLDQLKDAIQDGLRSVKNTIEDGAVVPGAGAFEIAASEHLRRNVLPAVKGKVQLGVAGFADALEVIPKTLAANSGADVSDVILELKQERAESGLAVGWNCRTNTLVIPSEEGIWDNVRVKRQGLHLSVVLANQLLLVDEVMRAGKQMGRAPNAGQDDM